MKGRRTLWYHAGLVIAATMLANPAAARCAATPESGIWSNADAELASLTRIEIQTTCSDGARGWKVRALTRCARTHCTWGYSRGVRRPDGSLAALFSTFAADRLVRMSVRDNTMTVAVINVFRGADRPRRIDRFVFERVYE